MFLPHQQEEQLSIVAKSCKNLTHLELLFGLLSPKQLQTDLSQCSRLISLRCDLSVDPIKLPRQLQSFHTRYGRVSVEHLLKRCPELIHITEGNLNSKHTLEMIKEYANPKLERLSLTISHPTPSFDVLSQFPNLQRIDITEFEPDDSFGEAFCKAMGSQLRHLKLISPAISINNKFLQNVAKFNPELRHLEIQGLQRVLRFGVTPFRKLGKSCPHLHTIILSFCGKNISGKFLSALVESNSQHLEKLSVWWDSKSIEGDPQLFNHLSTCRKLRSLTLRGDTIPFSGQNLENLGKGCPNLQELEVFVAPELTEASILNFLRLCPSLRKWRLTSDVPSLQELISRLYKMNKHN